MEPVVCEDGVYSPRLYFDVGQVIKFSKIKTSLKTLYYTVGVE